MLESDGVRRLAAGEVVPVIDSVTGLVAWVGRVEKWTPNGKHLIVRTRSGRGAATIRFTGRGVRIGLDTQRLGAPMSREFDAFFGEGAGWGEGSGDGCGARDGGGWGDGYGSGIDNGNGTGWGYVV